MKPVPVIVTLVPLAVVPEVGLTAVTVGVAVPPPPPPPPPPPTVKALELTELATPLMPGVAVKV